VAKDADRLLLPYHLLPSRESCTLFQARLLINAKVVEAVRSMLVIGPSRSRTRAHLGRFERVFGRLSEYQAY